MRGDVIWNGRRDTPGGRLLFADEHPSVPPPVVPKAPQGRPAIRNNARGLVCDLLCLRPMTMGELCGYTALSLQSISKAIYALSKEGVVMKTGSIVSKGRVGGGGVRRQERLYGLVVKGDA